MRNPITVSLHLGAHKTASTHFQKILNANSDVLSGAGVTYFGPSDLRGPQQSIQHKFGFEGTKRVSPDSASGALHDLVGDSERLVLSEENFLGPLYGGEGKAGIPLYGRAHIRVEKLARAVQGNRLTLFVAVRDPASFFVSAYSQGMLAGKYVPFSKFIRRLDPSQIFWSELIGRLSRIEGVAEIFVWRYEDYPRIATTVLRHLVGSDVAPRIQLSGGLAHVGLSANAVEHILSHTNATSDPKLGRAARKLFPVSGEQPKFQPWRPEVLVNSRAAYDADLAQLDDIDGATFIR